MTAIDPEVMQRLGLTPQVGVHQVRPKMSEEAEAEMLRRLADEENYKRYLNRVGMAHQLIVNPEFNAIMKADAHASNEDRDLARTVRRNALSVLASYLESPGSA